MKNTELEIDKKFLKSLDKHILLTSLFLLAFILFFLFYDDLSTRRHIVTSSFFAIYVLFVCLVTKYTHSRLFYKVFSFLGFLLFMFYVFYHPMVSEEFITYLINVF